MPYVDDDGNFAPPNPQAYGTSPPDPPNPGPYIGTLPPDPPPTEEEAAAASEDPYDDEEVATKRAQKEWDDYWNSLDPWAKNAVLRALGEGPMDPAILAGMGGPPLPEDQTSGYDDYPFEDKIKQYIETKDPALKAEIENAIWWITTFYASQGDRETAAEMQKWYEDMTQLMADIDAGKYDPPEEQAEDVPQDFGEYFDDDPHRGRPKPNSAPNAFARAYQQQAKYFHDFATFGASGTSLGRRRKRSQTRRKWRGRKWKWIDPYPWIPGTGPEKQVFEVLVRRGIYFIFQGQAPELEAGAYSTLAVPGFEPDFVLPQYKIIIDPFSPFHHSLAGAVQRDQQKVALYESLGYRYYHPWALAPNEWSFDQVGVNHGRFSTEDMLNQMPELGRPPAPLSERELPYAGQGYRLGKNLGAGATSVAAANRARARAATLIFVRGYGSGRIGAGPPIPKRPLRKTL